MMCTVENLHESLVKTHGQFMHVSSEKAYRGESQGKWRIVRKGVEDVPEQLKYPDPPRILTPGKRNPVQVDKRIARTLRKMPKVAWVQDAPVDWAGGAEISNATVRMAGEACGFRIDCVTPAEFRPEILAGADLIVLNNLLNFEPAHLQKIQQEIWGHGVPYVKYEHDHRELGRPEFSRALFGRSAFNVFLSPYHRENHKRIGADGITLPLAIDPDAYREVRTVTRIKGSALLTNIRSIRSWDTVKEYIRNHKDMQFTEMSRSKIIVAPNVTHHNPVPPTEMSTVYSRFEYVVHLFDEPRAGERVVLEGALCGAKIITNEYVGHSSWGWPLKDSEELRRTLFNAPFQFWKAAAQVIR